jgi:excisionase family DNA binding protein
LGRKREHGSRDWLTPREVADILGVSRQAIYNRIENKTIRFEQHIEEPSGEVRYLIPRGAVAPPANLAESDDRNAERAIRVEDTVKLGVKEILQNQSAIIGLVREMKEAQREAIDTLKEQADTEKAYQQNVVSIMEDMRGLFKRESERQEERQRQEAKKRRSIWHRLISAKD